MIRRRMRRLLEATGILVVIGGLALLLSYVSDHPRNTIYARIPWRSGAVDQDPHWRTSFADLGLNGLADLRNLTQVNPAIDPWAGRWRIIPYVFLRPDEPPTDSAQSWSISVGHGLISVRVGESYSLYADTLGLEDRLLRQGIEHGYLADMQRIYGEQRGLSELATAVATND